MKVVYLAHSVLSRGGDKVVLGHLSRLATSGIEVVVKTNLVKTVFSLHPSLKVEKLPFSSKAGTLLSVIWEKHQGALVIATNMALACLLCVRNPGKVVFFAQGFEESYHKSLILKKVAAGFCHIGLGWMKIPVVAVSVPLADYLRKKYSAEVEIVENGVDKDCFYFEPSESLRIRKEGRKAILCLARKDHPKGFDLVPSIVARISARLSVPIEVWTIGEPAQGMFGDLVHRDFGYVEEEFLRRLYSTADLFLYPSRKEGLPLMVLEAFACGCPVVTTEAVCVAAHEKNALVSPVEDVETLAAFVVRLLRDEQLCQSLVAEGLSTASALNLEESYQNFKRALLRGRGR